MSNQRSWVSRSVSIAVGAMVAVVVGGSALPARAEVCNIKVVTDANPDYSDIGSMLHSITDNWPENRDKCWAIWYWNHIARRQTMPMVLHGMALTDPIRQFNDYGYTMCSTIAAGERRGSPRQREHQEPCQPMSLDTGRARRSQARWETTTWL